MKEIGIALIATIFLFFVSFIIVLPILSYIFGYGSVEGYNHLITHSLIITLIFTVIACSMIGSKYIIEQIQKEKGKEVE
ncbi:hypothetical protein [Halalkalibacillus halophilus]|uniref:hypothetical protein n=1 Tax=Halalkalibacillus halophilus TaxID=392827 RepID=UPI00042854C9|nr:hypothetical protein [Halalkalibacillus halophilus]